MIGPNYRMPQIDADKCDVCRQCIARKMCKLKALVQFESHELPYIDCELCRGFYGQGKIEIDGKRYQGQIQLVEIGSKKPAEEK